MDLFVILDEHSVAVWVAANLEIFLCKVAAVMMVTGTALEQYANFIDYECMRACGFYEVV